jgi:transcriptional regulator with XRE-family HTH domain
LLGELCNLVLNRKELGALVKAARKVKSEKIDKLYTQKLLASDLNKSQSYIGDIESGRTYPSFVLLTQIAEACGVSISFFQNNEKLNNNIEKFIKSQLDKKEDEDVSHIIEHIKNDPNLDMDYIHGHLKNGSDIILENKNTYSLGAFKTSEEAVQFLLSEPVIMNFLGVDVTKLNGNEVSEFINDFLNQLKLISYKYKK